jgi:hypothetical protein
MAEPIQTTRMRRLPTVFGVFTVFSDDIPDVKRFAQVNWWKSLTLEGKCFCRRAKPAHIGGHLPSLLGESMHDIVTQLSGSCALSVLINKEKWLELAC